MDALAGDLFKAEVLHDHHPVADVECLRNHKRLLRPGPAGPRIGMAPVDLVVVGGQVLPERTAWERGNVLVPRPASGRSWD